MEISAIIILIGIGLFLVVLEVFLLPGLVAGILGFILMISGLLWAYHAYGNTYGSLLLAGILLAFAFMVWWAIRSGLWKKIRLSEEIGSQVAVPPGELRVGETGQAVSRLAPMGTIRVGEIEIEAKSQDGFIDQGTPVVIVRIQNNLITVKHH